MSSCKDFSKIGISETKRYSGLAVCIDNGHGKDTCGKRSPYSACGVCPELPFFEWDFSRRLAKAIGDKLAKSGVNVYYVCPESKDIALGTRANRANSYKINHPKQKCLFISVHADAIGNGKEWKPGSNGWAAWTTRGQNNSDRLADCLYWAADEILKPAGRRIRRQTCDGDPDYESDFTVIKKADMPAVLTENFFYTDPDDCRYLLGDNAINEISDVHVRGILKFAREQYGM